MSTNRDSRDSSPKIQDKKIIAYPHVKITEKAKREKPQELAHRHLKRLDGNLKFRTSDGKIMTITYSAKTEQATELNNPEWLAQHAHIFRICGNLFHATWKNNPDKGFFFISGNKKSVNTDESHLKRGWINYSAVLRHRKNQKRVILNIIGKNRRAGREPKTWRQYVDSLNVSNVAPDGAKKEVA